MDRTWYKAITLKERIFSLRAINIDPAGQDFNLAQAEKRLRQWRARPGFSDDQFFNRRLAADGIDQAAFLYLLGEPVEAVQQRSTETPGWLSELLSESNKVKPASTVDDKNGGEHLNGFLNALNVLIEPRRKQLSQAAAKLAAKSAQPLFEPQAIEELLYRELSQKFRKWILPRTIFFKLAEDRTNGLLEGETPEERYQFFIKKISQPATAFALLAEFPVLGRQLITQLDHWLSHSLLFLQRLYQDGPLIQQRFGSDLGTVKDLRQLGDEHRNGAVMKLVFSQGLELVYKPKSLAVELHFQRLLNWFNELGHKPEFKTYQIIERGEYGWCEFLSHQSCSSSAQIERFYQRQGSNLALLYALAGCDMHYENIIAAGEYPLLIDLEMLFRRIIPGQSKHDSFELASDLIFNSVINVGLLPGRDQANDDYAGIDLSGLGGAPGQVQPVSAMWENEGTDEMRLVYRQTEWKAELLHNLPSLDGKTVGSQAYLADILQGFCDTYRTIIKYREQLLAEGGPLKEFQKAQVRVICRGTAKYSRLLSESFNPNMLRNSLPRDWLFDYLWIEVKNLNFEIAKVIVNAEIDDLQEGVIPHFTTYPDSLDLWTSSGEKLSHCFPETAMSQVYRRIENFHERDLARQCWFIKGAFAGLTGSSVRNKPHVWLNCADAPADVVEAENSQKLLAAAQAIGDKLANAAILGQDLATWLTLSFTDNGNYRFTHVELNLYDGIYGITLFLAYLGQVTGESRYTELAKAALRTAQQTPPDKYLLKSIGCFNGWGGVIYALTHLAVLWNDDKLLAQAQEIVETLPPQIEQDNKFDIISGAAGALAALLALYQIKPTEKILSTAIQCGEHLLKNAEKQPAGIGWSTITEQPLAGFSHGAAGFAWSLSSLARLTGDHRFYAAAQSALAYERSLFSAADRNWLDLRNPALTNGLSNDPIICTWCHGAAGIGLSRLNFQAELDTAETAAEIEIALRTTWENNFSLNTSICHGGLGNLELYLQAQQSGRMFGDLSVSKRLQLMTARLLEIVDNSGIEALTISPHGIELPGLMTGMAGAGYQLLRLAAPMEVPALLMLAPPLRSC